MTGRGLACYTPTPVSLLLPQKHNLVSQVTPVCPASVPWLDPWVQIYKQEKAVVISGAIMNYIRLLWGLSLMVFVKSSAQCLVVCGNGPINGSCCHHCNHHYEALWSHNVLCSISFAFSQVCPVCLPPKSLQLSSQLCKSQKTQSQSCSWPLLLFPCLLSHLLFRPHSFTSQEKQPDSPLWFFFFHGGDFSSLKNLPSMRIEQCCLLALCPQGWARSRCSRNTPRLFNNHHSLGQWFSQWGLWASSITAPGNLLEM